MKLANALLGISAKLCAIQAEVLTSVQICTQLKDF